MAIDANPPTAIDFLIQVERFYAGLTQVALLPSAADPEPNLGGKLLYIGELDAQGRALAVAANIAGAASLAATTDSGAQRQAIRDGVVDFVVNSLDEALRILKNEIRKREPVAVCVALAPEAVEREMQERGVRPDLIPEGLALGAKADPGFGPGVREIAPLAAEESQTPLTQALVTWSVASMATRWMPKLDAMAMDCLDAEAWETRRWLRLAPRYLGRLAQGVRVMRCAADDAQDFVARVELGFMRGEIGIPVEIQVSSRGLNDRYRFSPHQDSAHGS